MGKEKLFVAVEEDKKKVLQLIRASL